MVVVVAPGISGTSEVKFDTFDRFGIMRGRVVWKNDSLELNCEEPAGGKAVEPCGGSIDEPLGER